MKLALALAIIVGEVVIAKMFPVVEHSAAFTAGMLIGRFCSPAVSQGKAERP